MPDASRLRRSAAAAACLFACACARLPEPESPGAQLYAERCTSCHRAYQPRVMTYEMWRLVLGRMQGVMSRNGLKPLTEDEMAVLLEYLKRHSG